LYVLLAGTLALWGCAGQKTADGPVQIVGEDGATTAEVIEAAEDVLARMHFDIEKLDVEQGIVRTRPLRGAQFFEFWRSDNASGFDTAEANLQSIRRSVELRVRAEDGGQRAEDSTVLHLPSGLLVTCQVSVQRLSFPENEVAGVSEAYRIHSSGTATVRRIDVTPRQRYAMTWIDLGPDPHLATRILQRLERRLQRAN
jgi:hypothetical protein